MRDEKILILCGGRGKRLNEYTLEKPKSLVQVGDKTLLEHKLTQYQKQKFNKFIFCVGYLGNMISEHIKRLSIDGEFSDAGLDAGILKRLYEARSLMTKPTIVSYGDTCAHLDLMDLLHCHDRSGSPVTLVTANIMNPFGLVEWNNDQMITSFKEKPILNHYIGYMVMDPSVFDLIPEKIVSLEDGKGLVKAFQLLASMGELHAYPYSGLQITVNTPSELAEARRTIGEYYTIQE
jgi:NDP-sugar pyrophosphorylase family protein